MKTYKRVLTIAGSDSGGGAGIQADLKTFSACGCYGMSAITAVTAQNTLGVRDIHPIPVATIASQIQAVLDDIGVDAIKIGMLHSPEVIECVASLLKEYDCQRVILDPVMVATSGDPLIEEDAVMVMKERLFPLVDLITPNIPETEILLERKITGGGEVASVARKLSEEYGVSALVKAGHLEDDEIKDVLSIMGNTEHVEFVNKKIVTENSHGTGCSLSSAIASFTAHGFNLEKAVEKAEEYLHGALAGGSQYTLGRGHGPVHHFFHFWQ